MGAALGASSAQACSVCIAHALGAALSSIGAQTLEKGSTVVGLSYMSLSKSNRNEEGGTERHSENQISLDVLHGLSDQLMLDVSISYVHKRLKDGDEPAVRASGIGDAVVGLTYQLPIKKDDPFITALNLDVKLPTGANNLKSEGALRDQHEQIGTGSTDVTFGAIFTWEGKNHSLWYGGLRYRFNGDNSRGYRYGNALFYNVGSSFALGKTDMGALELNGRFAQKDRTEEGEHDPNSGGHLTYLTGTYRHPFGKNMGLILSYELPVLKNLNGHQSEGGVFTASVTTLLP